MRFFSIRAMVSSFGGPEVAYAPGSAVSKQDPEDLEPALAVARGSDVLVVCVGIDATIESSPGATKYRKSFL